jgi:hypothetical protein
MGGEVGRGDGEEDEDAAGGGGSVDSGRTETDGEDGEMLFLPCSALNRLTQYHFCVKLLRTKWVSKWNGHREQPAVKGRQRLKQRQT